MKRAKRINNIKNKQFTFWYDPGHEWLEVTYEDIQEIGLEPTDFTDFSYMDGHIYYLEGDCDASKFAKAWESKYKKKISFSDKDVDSIGLNIRGLPKNKPLSDFISDHFEMVHIK